MKEKIFHDGTYTKEITIDFDCETEGCDETYSFHQDGWDIDENVQCECGAEYSVSGDIDDGQSSVYQTKAAEINEETGEFEVPVKPAYNQIDLFYNKTYRELRDVGAVS